MTTSALLMATSMLFSAADYSVNLRLRTDNRAGVMPAAATASNIANHETPPLTQATGYFLLEPGISAQARFRDSLLSTQYTPQLTLRLPVTNWRPLTMHRLALNYSAGGNGRLHFISDANAAIGEMDSSIAARSTTDFAGGVLGTVPTVQRLYYLSLSGSAGLSVPVSRRLTLSTLLLGSKLDSLGQATSGALQAQQRIQSTAQLTFQQTPTRLWRGEVMLNRITFPATVSYAGVTPSLAAEFQVGRTSRMTTRAGTLFYWQTPKDKPTLDVQRIYVADITAETQMFHVGSQRVNGLAQLGVTPYYDLISGTVEPRSTLSLGADWRVASAVTVNVSGQWMTPLNFVDSRWVGTKTSGDDHIVIGNAGVGYAYSPNIMMMAGMQVFSRWRLARDGDAGYFQPQILGFFTLSMTMAVVE